MNDKEITIIFGPVKDGIVKVRSYCNTKAGTRWQDSEFNIELPIRAMLELIQADADAAAEYDARDGKS